MCTGNTIKATVGNETNCVTCDGIKEVANENHTTCGRSMYYIKTRRNFCVKDIWNI